VNALGNIAGLLSLLLLEVQGFLTVRSLVWKDEDVGDSDGDDKAVGAKGGGGENDNDDAPSTTVTAAVVAGLFGTAAPPMIVSLAVIVGLSLAGSVASSQRRFLLSTTAIWVPLGTEVRSIQEQGGGRSG
jgi:hypothetical protein